MERFFDFEIYILYILAKQVNPLSANPQKQSYTLKQFVGF